MVIAPVDDITVEEGLSAVSIIIAVIVRLFRRKGRNKVSISNEEYNHGHTSPETETGRSV